MPGDTAEPTATKTLLPARCAELWAAQGTDRSPRAETWAFLLGSHRGEVGQGAYSTLSSASSLLKGLPLLISTVKTLRQALVLLCSGMCPRLAQSCRWLGGRAGSTGAKRPRHVGRQPPANQRRHRAQEHGDGCTIACPTF